MKLEILRSEQKIGRIASDIASVEVIASPSLIDAKDILGDLLDENEDFSQLLFPDATQDLSATLPPPPIPTSATSTISLVHPDPLSTPRSPWSGRAMDESLQEDNHQDASFSHKSSSLGEGPAESLLQSGRGGEVVGDDNSHLPNRRNPPHKLFVYTMLEC